MERMARLALEIARWFTVIIFTAFLIVQCLPNDPPVRMTTHLQAFDLMKEEVLKNHMNKLKSIDADASIFEGIDMDISDDWPCNKPARYSTSIPTDFKGKVIKLFDNRRGSCPNCWNLSKISALVTRAGEVYDVKINKEPSWRRYFREDGTSRKPGDEGEQCGPADKVPSYVRKSPRSR